MRCLPAILLKKTLAKEVFVPAQTFSSDTLGMHHRENAIIALAGLCAHVHHACDVLWFTPY
jgi:hypothetical protein